MQRSFSVTIGAITWVGLSYLLTVVATLVLMGRISDMVGRKLIYVYGFVVFTGASVLCALAPSLGLLLVGRVVQGIGAAMIQANSVAIVYLAVPTASRTRALGIQAASQAVGLAIGPTLGGLLLQVVTWRFLFMVNLPIGVVAFIAALAFIPRSRNLAPREQLDWWGSAYLFLGIGLILVGLSSGEHLGWSSPGIVSSLAVGAVIMVAFVVHEQRAAKPLVSIALLRTRNVSFGITAGALSYFVLYATLFLVPFDIERVLFRSSGVAGLVLLGLPGSLALFAPLAGRLSSRFGASTMVALSGITMAGGAMMLGHAGEHLPFAAGGSRLWGLVLAYSTP
jgi:EmrB/QacA subfamily drug resistance transporter